MKTPPDETFDWVKARSECSIRKAFTRLRIRVESDCKKRNDLTAGQFEILADEDPDRFDVFRKDGSGAVAFSLEPEAIRIQGSQGIDVGFRVSLSLNAYGECVFVDTEGHEWLTWQVARKALEPFFF